MDSAPVHHLHRLRNPGIASFTENIHPNAPPPVGSHPPTLGPIRGVLPPRRSLFQSLDNLLEPSPAFSLYKRRIASDSLAQIQQQRKQHHQHQRSVTFPPTPPASESNNSDLPLQPHSPSPDVEKDTGEARLESTELERRAVWRALREEAPTAAAKWGKSPWRAPEVVDRQPNDPGMDSHVPKLWPDELYRLTRPSPAPLLADSRSLPSSVDAPTPKRAIRPKLSTKGLAPLRHELRGSSGVIEILTEPLGDVLMDLRPKVGCVLLISSDGSRISIFENLRRAPDPLVLLHPSHTFNRNDLPPQYEKLYTLAVKFVERLLSFQPKVSFFVQNPQAAKITIFSDTLATYSVKFLETKHLLTIRVNRQQGNLRLSFPFLWGSTSTPNAGNGPQQSTARLPSSSIPRSQHRLTKKFGITETDWSGMRSELKPLARAALCMETVVDQMVKASSSVLREHQTLSVSRATQSSQRLEVLASFSGTTSRAIQIQTPVDSIENAIVAMSHLAKSILPNSSHGNEKDNDTTAPIVLSSSSSYLKSCLPGVGWALRKPCQKVEILFFDGRELEIDTGRLVVKWEGQRYRLEGSEVPHVLLLRLGLACKLLSQLQRCTPST
ncbi:hypothetical protein T439DRAFT_251195 [Meredithblackwellia eburnea MCA 4105]